MKWLTERIRLCDGFGRAAMSVLFRLAEENSATDMMALVGLVGLVSIGTGGFDRATGMMVLVGPQGLISVDRKRYQLATCHTFHMHA